jgi:glutathione S-transferase
MVGGEEQGSISEIPARTRRRTMWLEMKVKGLALEPLSNMPMLILRDEEEKRSLPIWVGLFEANAIALELEKISPPAQRGGSGPLRLARVDPAHCARARRRRTLGVYDELTAFTIWR